MDNTDHLAALRRDGARLREVAATASIDSPVASCPAWQFGDLIRHVAEVYHFWGSVVVQRSTTGDDVEPLGKVPDEELLATYDDRFARLTAALATTPASTEVWSWSAQHDVAFAARRMAHETAMHLWDAQDAAGTPSPIDARLASDGIDEFLEHFLADVRPAAATVGGSVHIHCGDTPGEWTIRPVDHGFEVTREHAKGDCALRGGASNLLLAIWRRTGIDDIDVVGDTSVAARFLSNTNLA